MASEEILVKATERLELIPVKHYMDYVEWDPQDASRSKPSLANSNDRDSDLAKRFERGQKVVNHKGEDVYAVTATHRFICMVPGIKYPVSVGFRKTSFKHGKAWLNLAFYRGDLPLYAGKYTLRSEPKINSRSEEYYEMMVENAGWVTEEEFAEAKEVHAKVKDIGAVKVTGEDEAETRPETTEGPAI